LIHGPAPQSTDPWICNAFTLGRVGLATACSSTEVKSGGGGEGGTGGESPPEGELKLDRNPTKSLTCRDPQAPNVGATPLVRLSNAEYDNTLRDLLTGIDVSGDKLPTSGLRPGFAPDDALGATKDMVNSIGTLANPSALKVGANLGKLGISACPPVNADAEGACLDAFIDGFAMRAYRRPVRDDERIRIKAFVAEQRKSDDFPTAIATLVEGMLQSPQFQYRLELGSAAENGVAKLSGYELASRLSYLFWESMPDHELFKAATNGDLDSPEGLEKQVKRMLAHERSRALAGRFTHLWLGLEERLPKPLRCHEAIQNLTVTSCSPALACSALRTFCPPCAQATPRGRRPSASC